jgi:hypothetical protein
MENSKSNGNEDISNDQVVDSIIHLRDALVEISQTLRDLLFEIESTEYRNAEEYAIELLQRLNRGA